MFLNQVCILPWQHTCVALATCRKWHPIWTHRPRGKPARSGFFSRGNDKTNLAKAETSWEILKRGFKVRLHLDFICAETKEVSDVLEQVTGRAFTKHGSHCSSPKILESQDAPDYISSARSHPHGAPDPQPLSEQPSNLPSPSLSWTLFISSCSHDDIIASQKPLVPSIVKDKPY